MTRIFAIIVTTILLSIFAGVNVAHAWQYGYSEFEFGYDSCDRVEYFFKDEAGNSLQVDNVQIIITEPILGTILVNQPLTNTSHYVSPCVDVTLAIQSIVVASESGYGGQVMSGHGYVLLGHPPIRLKHTVRLTPYRTSYYSPTSPAPLQVYSTATPHRTFYATTKPVNGDIDFLADFGIQYSADGGTSWDNVTDKVEYGSKFSPLNLTPDASGRFIMPDKTIPDPIDGRYRWAFVFLDQEAPVNDLNTTEPSTIWGGRPGPFDAEFILAADLSASTPTTSDPLASGSSVTFTGNIKNESAEIIASSSTARYRIDVGNDGSWDTILGTPAVSQLEPGDQQTVSSDSWTAQVGQHRVQLCANYLGDVYDSNMSNDCSPALVVNIPPEQPHDLHMTYGCDQATFIWSGVSEADGYVLVVNGTEYPVGTSTTVVRTVQPNTAYTWGVYATLSGSPSPTTDGPPFTTPLCSTNAWLQLTGNGIGNTTGDMHTNSDIIMSYPDDIHLYATGTTGIASILGEGSDFDLPTSTLQQWYINNYPEAVESPTISELSNGLNVHDSTQSELNTPLTCPSGKNAIKVTPTSGVVQINSWTASTNCQVIVIGEPGQSVDLEINTDITTDGQVFLITGDLNIRGDVTELHGIFIWDGYFDDAYNGQVDQPLAVYGSLIALNSSHGFNRSDGTSGLRRDLGIGNLTQAAETITYQPDYLIQLRNVFSTPQVMWREAPQ